MSEGKLKLKIEDFKLSEIKTTQEAIEAAKRFMENAKEILHQNIHKENPEYYKDSKYVIKASGILYIAFKIILKGFYLLDQDYYDKNIPKIVEELLRKKMIGKNVTKKRIEQEIDRLYKFYNIELMKLLGSLIKARIKSNNLYLNEYAIDFQTIYEIIHVLGYYQGLLDKPTIERSIALIERYLEILEQENKFK
jgi:hypothetical protein